MYMRNLPGTTLDDLHTQLDRRQITWGGGLHQVEVKLDRPEGERVVRFGEHEVPATKSGLDVLAKFVNIPGPFFGKITPEEQEFLLNRRMSHTGGELTLAFDQDNGISEVRKPGQTVIEPVRLVDSAIRVLTGDALVVEDWLTGDDFRVDIIVPEGFDRFIGGDPGVGDITRGGVRIGQDRKNNLAPWVQGYTYRLVCTNGMELPDASLKVDVRHLDARQIEAAFEAEIRRATDRLEQDIQAFYDLRNEPVGDDPTGAMRRVATERGLPARTVGRLEDMVPAMVTEANGNPSMFDLVNVITNLANDPAMGVRSTTVRGLQRSGGAVVHDHGTRCGTCHSRIAT